MKCKINVNKEITIFALKIFSNMITFTKHSLKKLELLFEEIGYVVRYERGNFNSGYCIVEERKIAIINKFFDAEGRINVLLDILDNVEFDAAILSEKSAKFYGQILKHQDSEEEKEDVTEKTETEG